MIAGRRCVSCYNREIEFVRGSNRRGSTPALRLADHRIGVVVDAGGDAEEYVELAEPASLDALELAVGALRVVAGGIAIVPARGADAIGLADLARRYGRGRRKPKPTRHKPMRRRHVMPHASRSPQTVMISLPIPGPISASRIRVR
jgi:hypothetical protein